MSARARSRIEGTVGTDLGGQPHVGRKGGGGMRVTMASAAARAGRVNEDFAGAVPSAAVLIDGAGIPGAEAICRHGVAWYASRLGGGLLTLLSLMPDRSLSTLLAEA